MTGQLRILVVDDDRRMVKTIRDILTVKGYESVGAYSGEEAVAMAKENGPDCVLMDLKMPGINGIDALRLIKTTSPGLPVVLMSAYVTPDQVQEAKRLGAYTVLTKPIDLQQLLSFLSLLKREESILVIDEDPVFCQTIKDILEEKGYRVETGLETVDILGHIEGNEPLVVVLDLRLGDENGLEVLRKIQVKYPTVPVVMVTTHGEKTANLRMAEATGAYSCLSKPLEIDRLVTIIEQVSRGKKQVILGEPSDARHMIGG